MTEGVDELQDLAQAVKEFGSGSVPSGTHSVSHAVHLFLDVLNRESDARWRHGRAKQLYSIVRNRGLPGC